MVICKNTEYTNSFNKEGKNTMTKNDLVARLAEVVSEQSEVKVSKKFARELLDSVVSLFTDELTQHGELSVAGFGRFKVTERSYTVFPGKPGEKKDKSLATRISRKNVGFRPAKALKEVTNASQPQAQA
jgi:nucleoid DNA-binding protein